MTTERDILQALEGLPPTVLDQVKDFITLPQRNEGLTAAYPGGEGVSEKAIGSYQEVGRHEPGVRIHR